MIEQQENMKVPSELIPHCPVCGKPMTMNLRSDDKFVEDEGWHRAAEIIKYPFWQLTAQNKNAVYACVNLGESYCPDEIVDQSVCVNSDIGKVIKDLGE